MNLANALSTLRLLLAPVLVLLAWRGMLEPFTWTFALSLLTDILDGKVARWLNQQSKTGAVLDSLADLATYSVVPFCALWLKPALVARETIAFWVTVWAYLFPVVVGFARFRRLTSYHTRSAVFAAYLMGAAILAMFAWDTTLPWRTVLPFLLLAALENLAITAVLPSWRPNVPTIFRALEIRRTERGAASPLATS